MNKVAVIISLTILVTASIVCVAALSLHGDNKAGEESKRTTDILPWGEEMETKIKQDYLDFYTKKHTPDATIDDVYVLKYYGTNMICVAVMMTDRYTMYSMAIEWETIDGVIFGYPSSNKIQIWEQGKFYCMQEAFDKGFLIHYDLVEIQKTHMAANEHIYSLL